MMQRQNRRCFLGAMICCVDVLKMFSSCENISQDVLQCYGCFDSVVQFAIPAWLLLRYTALCVMQFSPRNILYSNLRYNNTTSKHFLLWICNLHNVVPVKDGHDRTYHEQAVSTPQTTNELPEIWKSASSTRSRVREKYKILAFMTFMIKSVIQLRNLDTELRSIGSPWLWWMHPSAVRTRKTIWRRNQSD